MFYDATGEGAVSLAGAPPTSPHLRAWLYTHNTSDLISELILINLDRIRSPTFQAKYHDSSGTGNKLQTSVGSAHACPCKIRFLDSLWNIAGTGDDWRRGSKLGADLVFWPQNK